MTEEEFQGIRMELIRLHPECKVKLLRDGREIVAEVSTGLPVAMIEQSASHSYLRTREIYRVLRGILLVACEGKGHMLQAEGTLTIDLGQTQVAWAMGKPAWVEVKSTPPWHPDDHFILQGMSDKSTKVRDGPTAGMQSRETH